MTQPEFPLTVEIDEEASPVVVTLAGDFDVANAEMVTERLLPVLDSGPEGLVFDLSGIRFMDSSGIGLMVRTAARVGQVAVRRPSEIVRQVIVRMGLAEILVIEQ
jgi:anti-sigma B factor antagonist